MNNLDYDDDKRMMYDAFEKRDKERAVLERDEKDKQKAASTSTGAPAMVASTAAVSGETERAAGADATSTATVPAEAADQQTVCRAEQEEENPKLEGSGNHGDWNDQDVLHKRAIAYALDHSDPENITKKMGTASTPNKNGTPSHEGGNNDNGDEVGTSIVPPSLLSNQGQDVNRRESLPGAFHFEGVNSGELLRSSTSTIQIGIGGSDGQDIADLNNDEEAAAFLLSQGTSTIGNDNGNTTNNQTNTLNMNMPVANLVEDTSENQNNQPSSVAQPYHQMPNDKGRQEAVGTAARKNNQLLLTFMGIAVVVGMAVVIAVVLVTTTSNAADKAEEIAGSSSGNSTSATTTATTEEKPLSLEEYILSLLPDETVRGIRIELEDEEVEEEDLGGSSSSMTMMMNSGHNNFSAFTPQQKAFQWILGDPNLNTILPDQNRIQQRYALATIFYSLGGNTTGGWRKSDHWLSYEVHECNWYTAEATSPNDNPEQLTRLFSNDTEEGRDINSIPCSNPDDNNQSYEFLRLKDNDLIGTLPMELILLSNLKVLSLEGNSLQGTIPHQYWKQLTNLEEILLFSAELTGTIPSQIACLSDLKLLHLFHNQLTGTIPTEISLLSNKLLALAVYDNLLTGTLPTQLGMLSLLQGLSVDWQAMSGTIPTEIGLMTDMRLFNLAKNRFTGTLPPELWNLSKLEILWISTNNFHGRAFPPAIGQLKELQRLEVSTISDLTGPMPSQIGLLPKLWMIKASKNALSGKLPTELGLLTQMTVLTFHKNKLTGHLPSQLGEMTLLRQLIAFQNDFSGTVPTELGRIRKIERVFSLASCNLTGTIPSELGLVDIAHTFDLSHNRLTGTLPTQLGNLHGSTVLSLFGNLLSGPIPSELGALDSNSEALEMVTNVNLERNISKIRLWGNNLTGTVPAALGMLRSLQLLEIHNNSGLAGSIPTNLCSLETWPDTGGISVDCDLVNCSCGACVCN